MFRQEELRAAEGAGMSVKGGIFQKSIEKANLKFASESDDFLNESRNGIMRIDPVHPSIFYALYQITNRGQPAVPSTELSNKL